MEAKDVSKLTTERVLLQESQTKKDISKTYFISGHRDITAEEFQNYSQALDKIIKEIPDASFVVGDYYGVDIMAQDYLINVLKIDPAQITVYHMFDKPRNINEKITNTVGGFETDEERDAAMTTNSSHDIAFVRNHKKLSGTAQNILRRHSF